MRAKSQWILGPPPDRDARARLFCFPYAGGGASAFLPWRALFAPRSIDLVCVQLPGRETRFSEPLVTAMPDLVTQICDAIAPHLDRRFSLFGHSMGAVIAYEVAREVARRGQRQPEWLFVSGSVAPHRRTFESLHTLPPAEFIETVAERYNGIPREIFEHQELLELATPILQADFALMELYRYHPGPLLSAKIAAFGGDADPSVPPAELDSWRDLTSDPHFETYVLPGDHFVLNQHRQRIADTIARLVG